MSGIGFSGVSNFAYTAVATALGVIATGGVSGTGVTVAASVTPPPSTFAVKSAAGTSYSTSRNVLSAAGTSYAVSATVLSANGTSYTPI